VTDPVENKTGRYIWRGCKNRRYLRRTFLTGKYLFFSLGAYFLDTDMRRLNWDCQS